MFHVGLLFEWKQYYHFLWIAANPKSVCFRLFVVILDGWTLLITPLGKLFTCCSFYTSLFAIWSSKCGLWAVFIVKKYIRKVLEPGRPTVYYFQGKNSTNLLLWNMCTVNFLPRQSSVMASWFGFNNKFRRQRKGLGNSVSSLDYRSPHQLSRAKRWKNLGREAAWRKE